MDFTNLEGAIFQNDKLTSNNKELRRCLYIQFANTLSLEKLFSSIITSFKIYINENVLIPNYDKDILYFLCEEQDYRFSSLKAVAKWEDLKVHIYSHPLFPVINIAHSLKRSHQGITKMNKIGYQHLYVLSPMTDTLETSNSNTLDLGAVDCFTLKKKLKTFQKAIEVDCESMLKYHDKNFTKIIETTVHVDILIFIDKCICKQLSQYLGLIYVEDLLIEIEENDMDSVFRRLNNKNVELCRLIQTFINKKLAMGYNNICLVHTLPLWENTSANVRGLISNKNDELLYLEPTETANFHVELGMNPSIFNYIEAISVIINNALSCESHVIAKYKCSEDSYCNVQLPLISIVPLYILRYFTQCKIKEQKHIII